MTAVVVQSFCGAAVVNETSLFDAVVATIWPSAFVGGGRRRREREAEEGLVRAASRSPRRSMSRRRS